MRNGWIGSGIALAVTALAARGQPVFTTTYGIEFSTIGDPGNPVVPQSVGPVFYSPGAPPLMVGAVNYEYRMARTEVTVAQWHEFITAYRPHYTGPNPNVTPFTGFWITWSPSQQQYVYDPATAQFPTDCSWRVAAAYANWLHNDKVNEAWAFQSGAYDVSTFTTNPNGSVNDQREHSPGARFWIPTLHEWTKAMHWDPDRYGPGQGGYWAYPHGSDEPPVSGPPGAGQTNGGLTGNPRHFAIKSYPDVQSPWGLWDGSGGQDEWTEWMATDNTRWIRGSAPGLPTNLFDRIDYFNEGHPASPGVGFRIAAIIPAPPSLGVLVIAVGVAQRRRTDS